jgi:hypothetical protein
MFPRRALVDEAGVLRQQRVERRQIARDDRVGGALKIALAQAMENAGLESSSRELTGSIKTLLDNRH